MSITKIVITGGPCAGKSTAMSWIQNAFTEKGYTVLFVPETATELIGGGVCPWTCGSNVEYQKCQMRLQLTKEQLFLQAAKTMPGEKILVVCDRGALDNRAYMNDEEFAKVLSDVGESEIELRDSYDAVFHLVTAAKGAEQFYSNANNEARYESIEEARDLDDRLLAAWSGHPHLRVIDNATDFGDKMMRLISEVSSFLDEPEPYEIERKFLIAYPDLEKLEAFPGCRRVEIIQTYLKPRNGCEVRVRQRGMDGHYIYFETMKRDVEEPSTGRRVEVERRLTQDEYLQLLMEADTTKHAIRKTRYCLAYDRQVFEIDVYPFWNDQAILEIELHDAQDEIRFPPMVTILREVTGEKEFRNSALAAR
ncbi:MAG: AAA family ATPase [Clostridiales bacterium]|nr:AAA family ATPase [Clostridiales bacterium]